MEEDPEAYVEERGDFPYFLVDGILACSEHAWQRLQPLIESSVEVLPLNFPGKYISPSTF
jgi:hypothetical protein